MALLRHHAKHLSKKPLITFWSIYPLSLLFVFHVFLVTYINSSYMERYLSPEGVGSLYIIGSSVAVFCFLFFSHALKAIGNVRLTLLLALIDGAALVVMGLTTHAPTAIVAFVTFLVVNPLLYLNIDIFSEVTIGSNESSTGSKRGLALGLMSIAAVISPLLMGWLVDGRNDLSIVYYTAAGFVGLFVIFLLTRFRTFKDPQYDIFKIRTSLRSMWEERDVRNVMFSHFLLQAFFAWTIIYFPLYLSTELGFKWDEISYIIAFALFAYVLFEWPTGVIADRWLGEKELMAVGFLILAISTAWVSTMTTTDIWPWMVLLFITRIGAALVEATTEAYFFKHTDGDDADTIGFFRLLRPLATVFGALLGSALLLYIPLNTLFMALGLCLVPGIYFTSRLKDTK